MGRRDHARPQGHVCPRRRSAGAWPTRPAPARRRRRGRPEPRARDSSSSRWTISRPGEPVNRCPSTRASGCCILQTPSDLCVALLGQRFDLHAPPLTHVSACAAGTDAIGSAFRMIASGRRRWMMAGGADSMINPLGVAGFCSIGATSTANDDPPRASRPFDRETLRIRARRGGRHADSRAARGRAGPRRAAAGRDLPATAPRSTPTASASRIPRAAAPSRPCRARSTRPERRRRHRLHQRARDRTPKNDPVETLAIKRLLGARVHDVPVCATKSMIGHLIAASGAVEAIAAIVGLRASVAHPTINLDHRDPACDLDYVPHAAREHPQRSYRRTRSPSGARMRPSSCGGRREAR